MGDRLRPRAIGPTAGGGATGGPSKQPRRTPGRFTPLCEVDVVIPRRSLSLTWWTCNRHGRRRQAGDALTTYDRDDISRESTGGNVNGAMREGNQDAPAQAQAPWRPLVGPVRAADDRAYVVRRCPQDPAACRRSAASYPGQIANVVSAYGPVDRDDVVDKPHISHRWGPLGLRSSTSITPENRPHIKSSSDSARRTASRRSGAGGPYPRQPAVTYADRRSCSRLPQPRLRRVPGPGLRCHRSVRRRPCARGTTAFPRPPPERRPPPARWLCEDRARRRRQIRTLGFAQRQASVIAPADDCFRPGRATELATALATFRSPRIRLAGFPARPRCRSGRADSA